MSSLQQRVSAFVSVFAAVAILPAACTDSTTPVESDGSGGVTSGGAAASGGKSSASMGGRAAPSSGGSSAQAGGKQEMGGDPLQVGGSAGEGNPGIGGAGTGGAGTGGNGEDGTPHQLSPTGDCSMEVTDEAYCRAMAVWADNCGGGPEWKVYTTCIGEPGPSAANLDPCYMGVVMRSCFGETCDWGSCMTEAIAQTHPDLLREEIAIPCSDFLNPPEDVDCSEPAHEGRWAACEEKAAECDASDRDCGTAALLRPELLPEVDACIQGVCAGLPSCIRAVIETKREG